nr:hypothetical protein [Tanacetum cinerariifolium]
MVLSSTYSMPPKQCPSYVLESLAVIAENLLKLVETMTINNEKLAASQSKLNVAITNLIATQNARLSAITTNNTHHPSSHTTSTQLPAQNEQLSSLVTPMPKPEPNNTDHTPPLPPPLSDSLQPLKSSTVITSLAPPSTIRMIKCLLPVEMKERRVDNICFKYLLNNFPRHQCKPPAYVFLQTELKPPWERHYPRYKTMILEDKDRFQDESIDTYKQLKTKVGNHALSLIH